MIKFVKYFAWYVAHNQQILAIIIMQISSSAKLNM